MFINGFKKTSCKGTMNDGIPSLSSDSEMAYKTKNQFLKNCHATFDKTIKSNYLPLKIDYYDLFKNRSKRPTFLPRLFFTMLNIEVDKIFLLQLEYEMDRTDYPVNYIF